jgi:hypothetical protein
MTATLLINIDVDNLARPVARAEAVGAKLEAGATHVGGRIAQMADPFGQGCA